MVIVENDHQLEQKVERKANVAEISTIDGTIVGYNFFDVSSYLTIEGHGQVAISDDQLAVLNEQLKQAGFTNQLQADHTPKFMVGFVKSCEAHPDSDHLSITEIDFADAHEPLQIVCGAPNIRKNLKVVVALPGAMMPDGLMIWPGELRGVKSYGMICSARELHLPNAPMKRGILELAADAVVGSSFTPGK
ncbi:tRNA-binding protein [Enterococcus columbae DSM 7374 = ATCC 51263]|uniref:tRNA-binding protein n=2 Tax=Enterococcus columbae TaxID=1355 RepID=S1NT09_9ENTE|nr:tRNA-binding protein [Enterococcus columbae DSM 7374 = ATCC 51263]EOW84024.1 tRNA-binding protein [Enterococcus columbae DSM 7374 = ATCC 51263]